MHTVSSGLPLLFDEQKNFIIKLMKEVTRDFTSCSKYYYVASNDDPM